jgi:hypothetical protein
MNLNVLNTIWCEGTGVVRLPRTQFSHPLVDDLVDKESSTSRMH